jgi:beta-glucosidase
MLRAQPPQPAYRNSKLTVDQRVADLLGRMTLEEKLAQLEGMWCLNFLPAPKKIMDPKGNFSPEMAKTALKDGIGQIAVTANGKDARQAVEFANAVQRWVRENTRLGIPVMFHEEALHGYAGVGGTSFPQAIALASTWDPALLEEVFAVAAREMRSRGTQQALAPVLDLGRDPRWGRIEETYGEDPYLVARLGLAAVRGLQGPGPGLASDRVFATAKHFAVYGQPEGGTNLGPCNYSERVIREQFLYPFEVAVKEGRIGAVMPSYNEIDGIPSHANSWLLDQVLRKEWGFEGFTVSDYFGIMLLQVGHKVAATPAEAGRQAIAAGVDLEFPWAYGYAELPDLVISGKVSTSSVDTAAGRILRAKFLAGLFENAEVNAAQTQGALGGESERALARKVAGRAIVLLKNEGNVLPFDRQAIGTLAVIGPNADRTLLGAYSGTPPYFVTVLEGIRKAAGPMKVVHALGCRITSDDKYSPSFASMRANIKPADPAEERRTIASALEVAKGADAVLLVLGGNEYVSREAISEQVLGDADTLDLPGLQDELAAAVLKLGKPVAVLLLNGRPYSVNFLAKNVPAILEGWYLGQETGNAVADVLFGEVSPGGRLPVTIARNVGQIPAYYYQKPTAKRGYIMSDKTPLFPFGHGLSYTTFRYSGLSVSPGKTGTSGTATVSVEVTNTGTRAGDEVVQMYIRDDVSSVTRPVMELRGFERVSLKPGETKVVSFPITPDKLSFLDRSMRRVVEPGTFHIMVGGSSARTTSIQFEVLQ